MYTTMPQQQQHYPPAPSPGSMLKQHQQPQHDPMNNFNYINNNHNKKKKAALNHLDFNQSQIQQQQQQQQQQQFNANFMNAQQLLTSSVKSSKSSKKLNLDAAMLYQNQQIAAALNGQSLALGFSSPLVDPLQQQFNANTNTNTNANQQTSSQNGAGFANFNQMLDNGAKSNTNMNSTRYMSKVDTKS